MKSIIKLKNVSKFYYSKGLIATGFSRINLDFKVGEFVAITGESGSGKSTLLNVISGLDTYEEGEMYINGEETSHYVEKDFENYRRKYIGNIFQNFNLVNSYTVYQNIELVLLLNGEKRRNIKKKVIDLIKKVDLYKFRNTKVSKLSGGQKQRVAIARALAKDTPIIIADEPTGNLDSAASQSVLRILHEVAKDKLVIIVTHNYEQVEEYVTRKIKMHDGKILEDKKLREVDSNIEIHENNVRDIRLLSKLRLGIRNTFNIVPKFLLILAVFLFVTAALMSEYAAFKELEDEEMRAGYNFAFSDLSIKRIIIKKDDKIPFTDEEYEKISKMSNVDYIFKNDVLIDRGIEFYHDDTWLHANVKSSSMFEGDLDFGVMPKEDNEVILSGNKDSWYFSDMMDEILNRTFYYYNYRDDKKVSFKIVGIKYTDEWNDTIYLNEKILDSINVYTNMETSEIKALFKGSYLMSQIVPSTKVPKGKAYISEDMDYLCKKYNCKKEKPYLRVEVNSKYYSDSIKLQVTNTYNKKTFNKLTGATDYANNNGSIYINENDYFSLFNKGFFQSSVYVKDEDYLDDTANSLERMGFTTLKMKDAIIESKADIVVRVFKIIVTVILVVVLFFISYFVVKIILKSRNVYYTTIRILGGTSGVSKELLLIELLNVANISYLIYIGILLLNYFKYIRVEEFDIVLKYLELKEYIAIYLILMIMSTLISHRFSKKLFKNSVMVTLGQEV